MVFIRFFSTKVFEIHNKSLHLIFTPLRFVKTSEFNLYAQRRI